MTRFKDFGGVDENSSVEPITFKLHGEEFTAMPEIQGAVLLEFIEKSGSEDASVSASNLISIFQDVLVPESLERFNILVQSKDRIVKVEKLGEIVGWLISEYSGRPEEQPED